MTISMSLTRELRQAAGDYDAESRLSNMLREASDEIERLQKRVTEARAILEPLAEFDPELRDEIQEWLK